MNERKIEDAMRLAVLRAKDASYAWTFPVDISWAADAQTSVVAMEMKIGTHLEQDRGARVAL